MHIHANVPYNYVTYICTSREDCSDVKAMNRRISICCRGNFTRRYFSLFPLKGFASSHILPPVCVQVAMKMARVCPLGISAVP